MGAGDQEVKIEFEEKKKYYRQEYDPDRPCPFCGSQVTFLERARNPIRRLFPTRYVFWIECSRCRAKGPVNENSEAAGNDWDTRMV